jgi:hypothetical protein
MYHPNGNSAEHVRGPLGTNELVQMNMKAEDRLELATLKVKQFLVGKEPNGQVIDVLEPWRRAPGQ